MEEISRDCASDSARESSVLSFPRGQKLLSLPFAQIRAFAGHPFRLYQGERLADMVESIRQNGILMPLIVRRIYGESDCDYEMLSGHNRMNAAGIVGLTEALCLVKEDITDTEALMYVIETNLMQRSFTDLLPSEKAAVLALRYSEMFSQGKRNDILRELRLLEDPGAATEEPLTCGTEFHKLNSRDSVGKEYGLTGRMVASYLRIDTLLECLKLRLDNGGMTLKAGVALSYLGKQNQQTVENALCGQRRKLTDGQAAALRRRDEELSLTVDIVLELLNATAPKSAGVVQVRRETYAPYFPPSTSPTEIEQVIAEALRLYFAQKEEASA